jgi:hypothetical protein
MRNELVVFWMLLFSVTSATAQVSVGIGLPNVSIGINLPLYPELERVPGYPVYYAPGLDSNYFFYDGLYWVYQDDNWYASSWYNGPWRVVGPVDVPLFILRVPVRYYRHPPAYFHGWYANSPPRWGEHWGHDWSQRRSGWDRWNRKSAPRPAPLPAYQREYAGDRYPGADRQHELRSRNYSHQPRDAVARQHYQGPRMERAPSPPRAQPARDPGDRQPKAVPQVQQRNPQPQQREAVQRRQPEPNARGQEARPQGRGQGAERDSGPGRGREDRNRGNDRDDAGGRGPDRGR